MNPKSLVKAAPAAEVAQDVKTQLLRFCCYPAARLLFTRSGHTIIRQIPEYSNETGLLAIVLATEVFRIVPGRFPGFFSKLPVLGVNLAPYKPCGYMALWETWSLLCQARQGIKDLFRMTG